ncbi:aminotransferase class I/II-fold pyridoxal phosphate-dependent enzyme [Entomobacter blattae]|uniref:8-amino-7-oxononanoate synthase n=1 Tax=Entomobacter blattae TaxID=2762277 RepID=A0A7H1NSE1_9PROT|nr:pyridoxal phosphate-dependent aminotransferase family protein [Entomobacter blattae]QNT78701.1 8-amino-7-oxononanoate synthase 2 [Entomobacter blattae]
MTGLEIKLREALELLEKKHLKRTVYAPFSGQEKPKNWIDFSSNDYLGLAQDAFLKDRSKEWLSLYGSGVGSSRLVSGSLSPFLEVERVLAHFHGKERALVFASGWQCNVAALSCIINFARETYLEEPLVFTDRLNHASLHYGCALGGARQIRFRHNDLNHLKERLQSCQHKKGQRFIVTESVFSMDGDQVDIDSLLELAQQFSAFVYVDEAHACGLYGPEGRGFSYGKPGCAVVMGTLSKAFGGFGGYVATSAALCEWLVNKSSGFIHTTALPPAVWGALSAALEKIPSMRYERQELVEKAQFVRQKFRAMGLNIAQSTTHIIPVIFSSSAQALRVAECLKTYGIYTVAIRPPTVPVGQSRIRFTLCAFHQWKDIEILCQAMAEIISELQIEEGAEERSSRWKL